VGVHTRTWALYGCGYPCYWFALFPTKDQQNEQFQVWQLQYLQIFFDNPFTVWMLLLTLWLSTPLKRGRSPRVFLVKFILLIFSLTLLSIVPGLLLLWSLWVSPQTSLGNCPHSAWHGIFGQWVMQENNLIFLGLYFVIAKCTFWFKSAWPTSISVPSNSISIFLSQ